MLGTLRGSHAEIIEFLTEYTVGRMLMILPSWACLVRTIRLPASNNTPQLMSALRLEAETRLLGSMPEHRSAMAILVPDTAHPVGLVCSWPTTVKTTPAPLPNNSNIEVNWVPEIAALAAATGGENTFAAVFDPESGSLAASVPTPSGPSFRSTREPVGSGAEWANRINAIVRETLISEHVDPIEVARQATAASDEVRRQHGDSGYFLTLPANSDAILTDGVDGAESLLSEPDANAWRLLLGAFQTQRGSLAPLAKLREHAALQHPSLLKKLNNRMSTGRFAVAVVIACIILIVLTPLAASSLRLLLVRNKIENIQALKTSVRHTENLIEVYRTLNDEAWSMTKMLGDISNCMPDTLEISSIVLTHGEPISLDGISKSSGSSDGAEAVLEFATRLRATGLFDTVEPSFSPPDGRGIRDFKITAEVTQQAKPVHFPEEDDFALTSFSERRWGAVDEDGYLIGSGSGSGNHESATLPARSLASDENPTRQPDTDDLSGTGSLEDGDALANARPGDGRRASPRGSSSTSTTRGAPRSRSEGRGEPATIPDPVTPEEVQAMNRSEALKGLSEVAKAKNAPGIDEETKNRLQQDFDLLMQRVRETAP